MGGLTVGDRVVLSELCVRYYFRGPRFPGRVGVVEKIPRRYSGAYREMVYVRWPGRKNLDHVRADFVAPAPEATP